jgi:hypothetical protein
MSEWKLVPVNPTAGMIDAAYETVLTQGELLSREAYHAMLAAAPVPTAADCTSVCDAYAAENQQFSDELARLRAENERLKAGARPYTVTCEPVIDRDWPEAHSVRIRNGGQRFDIGMHLETLEEAEHYATMLRVALGIDAAMTQGKL